MMVSKYDILIIMPNGVCTLDRSLKPWPWAYPGGIGTSSSCRFDTVYDLYTSKEKPHYSLFAGHVVKNNFHAFGSVDHSNIRSDTSMVNVFS